MVRDNVVFRITVDGKQAQQTFNMLEQQARKLGFAFERVKGQSDTLKTGLDKVGTSSTTAAVNFQTATQGMLNLSTAAVQTYTSISNLDRANNRAKQSIIAVARAEDLLNNKKERLNQLMVSGAASAGQLANMQREVATATADLTVKQEKQRIEQAAVNDIYMLFATNVANVTISSIQTLGVLLGTTRLKTFGLAAGTKILSLATRSYTVDALTASKAAGTWTGATSMGAIAAVKATFATHGLAAAFKVLTSSFAPLLIATAALTAAWAIHESDILGTKTAIDELIGVQDNFEQGLIAERNAINDVTGALDTQQSKLFELPSTYSGIQRKIKELKEHYDGLSRSINDNSNAIITNSQLQPNFRSGGGTSHISNGSLNATPSAVLQNSTPVTHSISSNPAVAQMTNPAGMMAVAWNITSDYQKWQAGYGSGGSFGGPVFRYPGASGGSFDIDSPIMAFTRMGDTYMPSGLKSKQAITEILGELHMGLAKRYAIENNISVDEAYQIIEEGEDYQDLVEQAIIIAERAGTRQAFLEQRQLSTFKRFTPETYADFKQDELFKKSLEIDAEKLRQRNIIGAIRAGITPKEYARRKNMRGLFSAFHNLPLAIKDSEGNIIGRRRSSGISALSKSDIKSLGGIRRVGGKLVHMEEKALFASLYSYQALQGKRDYGDDVFMNLVQDSLNTSGGLRLSNNDPRLKSTAGMGEIQSIVFNETGIDIGGVAETIGKTEALRLARQEKYIAKNFANTSGGYADVAIAYLNNQTKISEWGQMATMNDLMSSKHSFANVAAGRVMRTTNFFGTGFFKSTGASGASQVARGSINVQWRQAQIAVEDRNRNRMKTGGRRVLNEDGSPMFDLWDERAVEGGFTSISAYRDDWWTKFRAKGRQAESFAQMLGNETKSAATYNTASSLIGSMNSTMGLLGRTGLSLSSLPSRGDFMPRRAGGGIGNVGNRYFSIMASIGRQHSEAVSRTIAANQLTLKRAGQIDLLIGGFGLNSYYGSGLELQQLQLAVQKQDELIQSIGLNRTEAFRIIDTQGRGRNEIEDRVRWTQRNESISTGNIVL